MSDESRLERTLGKDASLAKVGAAILRMTARMRVQTEGVQLSS
jgi:hypothetical protein